MTKICEICSAPLKTKPSKVATGRGRFCSRACCAVWRTTQTGDKAPHWQGKKVTKTCQHCETEYIDYAHNLDSKFCSRSCASKQSNFKNGLWAQPWFKKLHASMRANIRRIRVQNAEGSYSIGDIVKLYIYQDGTCNMCGCDLVDYDIDHIRPISRGGSNWPTNLQLLCPPCNGKKWAKVA